MLLQLENISSFHIFPIRLSSHIFESFLFIFTLLEVFDHSQVNFYTNSHGNLIIYINTETIFPLGICLRMLAFSFITGYAPLKTLLGVFFALN